MKYTILTIIIGTIFSATTFAGGYKSGRTLSDIYRDLTSDKEPIMVMLNKQTCEHFSPAVFDMSKACLAVESNVDDFPYDTEIIANGYRANHLFSAMELSEESEGLDFPYDTEVIVKGIYCRSEFSKMKLADEQYVDDIPFDTQQVVNSLTETE